MIISSFSTNETKLIAFNLAKLICDGTIILLSGELGAGKTIFAKGLINGLGVKTIVSSPTFNVVKEYNIYNKLIFHIDLYRLHINDIISFGLEEYFYNPNAIILVEWPEKLIRINSLLRNIYMNIVNINIHVSNYYDLARYFFIKAN